MEKGAREFAVFVAVSLAGAVVCWWVSSLTAGPEYGGRFDLPAVNYVAWFLFCLCVAALFMSLVGAVLRSLAWLSDRMRSVRS